MMDFEPVRRPAAARRAAASLALLGALGAGAASAAAQSPTPGTRPSQAKAADLVKMELVADTTRLAPGKPVTLAAKFTIAEGWHIYWLNPGEAGLATEVSFTASAGYEVGPLRYPGPERFQTPGETAASYGYAKTAVLSSVATPAKGKKAAVAAGPVRFAAQATYLVCRDMCIRGQGSATLELPAASRAEPARPANADLLRHHRAELPRKLSELGAATAWKRDDRGVELVFTLKKADAVEYFPATVEDLQLVAQEPGGAGATRELHLRYKPSYKPAKARGVLAVSTGGGKERRFYAVDLDEKP